MQDFLDELDQELSGDSAAKTAQNTNTVENTKEGPVISSEKKAENSAEVSGETKKPVYNKPDHNKVAHTKFNKNTPHASKNAKFAKGPHGEVRGKFISKFPETKFYLPSLREGYTRYIPVG